MEAASVPASVSRKNHGELPVQAFPVPGDAVGPVDTPYDVDQGGERVRAGSRDQGEPLVPGDFRADAGVQAQGTDVDGIVGIAGYQIKFCLLRVQQSVQI